MVYFAPVEAYASAKEGESVLGQVWMFYVALMLLTGLYSVFAACMFVSQMAFFAKVSDPAIGGTYMTLLNTIANLGSLGSKILVTSGIDMLTWRKCRTPVNLSSDGSGEDLGTCTIPSGEKNDPLCAAQGGECGYEIDGYYIMVFLCFGVGVVWWVLFKNALSELQSQKAEAWRVSGGSGSWKWLAAVFGMVLALLYPALSKFWK